MGGDWKKYLGFGLMIVVGMIMMIIGYNVFPSLIEGADTARTATNVSEYIALEPIIEVGPTLVLMGFTFAGTGMMFLGGWGAYRAYKKKGK
jgi:hypothetical protein